VVDTRLMLSEKAARMGDKAKPLAAHADGFAVSERPPVRASIVLHEKGGEAARFGHHSDPHRFYQ